MTLYEELIERGLIAQVTNEEEISKMINEGKATFYIGFDPTADSLPYEASADGRQQAYCASRRRYGYDRRPFGQDGYEKDAHKGRY